MEDYAGRFGTTVEAMKNALPSVEAFMRNPQPSDIRLIFASTIHTSPSEKPSKTSSPPKNPGSPTQWQCSRFSRWASSPQEAFFSQSTTASNTLEDMEATEINKALKSAIDDKYPIVPNHTEGNRRRVFARSAFLEGAYFALSELIPTKQEAGLSMCPRVAFDFGSWCIDNGYRLGGKTYDEMFGLFVQESKTPKI